MNSLSWKKENTVLLFLMIFLVFYKFFTFRMFDIGGDAINYWFASKNILYHLPYGELDHQLSRFGLILPMWFSQVLFGSYAAVTLIVPNIFFVIHIILIYKIGVKIKSPAAGFIAALLFMLCPHIMRYGSQVVPEAIGGPLITATFYFLLKYNEDDRKEMLYLALSAFMLFWAYCAHETDIFFMPGFLLVILLFKKNLKHAFIYSAILFCLFLCETAIFYHYTGDIMARYHAITGHHFKLEKFVPIGFWDLFDRYTKTQLWWRIPFYSYLLMLYPVWKKGSNLVKASVIPGFIFFLLMLFAVKSINPIVPALAMKEAHLLFAVPFITFVLAVFSVDFFNFAKAKFSASAESSAPEYSGFKPYVVCLTVIIVAAFAVTASGKLPEKIAMYYNNPLKLRDHKLVRFFTYSNMFNNAYNNGTPIVSDYVYTVKDKEVYDKVQQQIAKGKNLDEALDIVGFDKGAYVYIRPNMPVKSLDGARKIFLHISPADVPEIKTAVINGRIVSYIINKKYVTDDKKNLLKYGDKVIFATQRELRAVEGVLNFNQKI